MDYDTAKAFLLNFWTRYLSSWALKALAGFLVVHGGAAEQAGSQASAILQGGLALIVFIADFCHSRAANQAALNAMPPKSIVDVSTNPVTGAVTTTAVQTTPAKGP